MKHYFEADEDRHARPGRSSQPVVQTLDARGRNSTRRVAAPPSFDAKSDNGTTRLLPEAKSNAAINATVKIVRAQRRTYRANWYK